MRRGGVKSFVDDLVLGRGVVISRAATSLRSVETQPLTRRFVRNQTNDISVPSLSRVGGLSGWCSLSPTGLGLFGANAHHGSLDCGSRLAASAGVAPRRSVLLWRARDTHGVSVLGLSRFLVRPSLGVRGTQVRLLPRAFILHVRFAVHMRLISEKLGTLARDPRRRPLPPPIQHENEQVLPRHPVCVCLSQVSLHSPRPTSLSSLSLVSLPV